MTGTATFETMRKAFADAWERRTRDDDSPFHCLVDSAPDWMTDSVHAAHTALDDRFPDDWVYEHISRILDDLGEYGIECADGARDRLYEIAAGLVDCYNSDRLKWLASHLGNAGLVDMACDDIGVTANDTFTRIGYGQCYALERIGFAIIDAIEEQIDDSDD